MATYNRAHLIEKSLDSIKNQTSSLWECIVVDDRSTDNTGEIVSSFCKKDPRFIYHVRPIDRPKGPSACRNFGIENAQGNYIQFFDDDDIMFPVLIEEKLSIIENSNIDVVIAPSLAFNVKKQNFTKQNEVFSENLVSDYVTGKLTWYCCGPLWRKEFLTERFDENIQTLEDWDFNLRNIYKNPKAKYLKQPLQQYNRYELGKTLSTKAQLGDERQVISGFMAYKKHFELLKKQNKITQHIKRWLMQRFTFLLRASLAGNFNISNQIFQFMYRNQKINDLKRFWKIILGYYCFKTFNKGYRLLKSY